MSRRRTEAFLKHRYIHLHRGIRRHTDKLVKNAHKLKPSQNSVEEGRKALIIRLRNLFKR